MHALSPAVAAYLSQLPAERARVLRAWFGAFLPSVQDILLEKAREVRHEAVFFGERTLSAGCV